MSKIKTKIELITPEITAQMLEKNTINRKPSAVQIERYAQAMLSGEWQENGQSIVFATDGTLLDGQQRLFAIIKSGVAILLLVRNVVRTAMATINTGLIRTLTHVLDIESVPNPKNAATITKLLFVHDISDTEMRLNNCKVSQRNALLEDFYDANSAIIDRATAVASTGKHHFVISHMGLCYALFARKSPVKADEFFNMLKTGANLTDKHPVMSLRAKLIDNRLNREKLSVRETTALYIKAWNAFIKGKPLSNFRWNSSEPLPEIK